MKKIFIIMLIIFNISFSLSSIKWPVRDSSRITKFAKKIKTILGNFDWIKDSYGLYNDLDTTFRNATEIFSEGTTLELEPDEWKEILEILKDKDYYLSNNAWKDVMETFSNLDDFKFPSLAPDYINRASNTAYYKENTEYKEYIDENKRIYKEETLKDLNTTKNMITNFYNTDSDRIERIDKLFKELKNSLQGFQGQEHGKVKSLSCFVEIEEMMQLQDTLIMIQTVIVKEIKDEIKQLDRNKRHQYLNRDNSKNIEKALKQE